MAPGMVGTLGIYWNELLCCFQPILRWLQHGEPLKRNVSASCWFPRGPEEKHLKHNRISTFWPFHEPRQQKNHLKHWRISHFVHLGGGRTEKQTLKSWRISHFVHLGGVGTEKQTLKHCRISPFVTIRVVTNGKQSVKCCRICKKHGKRSLS